MKSPLARQRTEKWARAREPCAGQVRPISAVAVLIFSLYLLHDLTRIVSGGETNYVMATLNLFLNVYNIFISLLNLLLVFSGQRD